MRTQDFAMGRPWYWWDANLNYTSTSLTAGLDSVVKSVAITRTGAAAANYSYRYDAFNRRRYKAYPFNGQEEFFYDTGQQLLSQRSGNVVGTATQWTVDDYIWLEGKPIAMIRGSFSSNFATRDLDTTASCYRFGEAGACGIYHLVSDYLPKPVLMLHALTGKIANVALYDDFGQPNRVPVAGTRPLPAASVVVADVQLPVGSSQNLQSRIFYNYLDMPTGVNVIVNGDSPVTGMAQGLVWSEWTGPSTTNPVEVRITSTACTGAECNRQGVMTEAIEYRRFEVGVTPMWTTMRLPGQQYDAETDLFENWNRFYEPTVGKYLSPEPMLQDPDFVRGMAQQGYATPTYAYALNNPLSFTDPDGLAATRDQWCRENPETCKDLHLPPFDPSEPDACGGDVRPAAGDDLKCSRAAGVAYSGCISKRPNNPYFCSAFAAGVWGLCMGYKIITRPPVLPN